MIMNTNDFEDMNPIKCNYCGVLVDKWINIIPGGNLCINCAQNMQRILLQDIIHYHTGTYVSLTDIMYHGTKDVNKHRLNWKQKPNGQKDEHKISNI